MAYNLKNFHKDLLDESPKLVREYLQHQLTVRARSPLTVEEYARDLITFFRFYKRYHELIPADKVINRIQKYRCLIFQMK